MKAGHNSMRVETLSVHAVPTEPFISQSGARAQNRLERGSKVHRANQKANPIAAKAVILGCGLGTKTQLVGGYRLEDWRWRASRPQKQVVVAQQGRWGRRQEMRQMRRDDIQGGEVRLETRTWRRASRFSRNITCDWTALQCELPGDDLPQSDWGGKASGKRCRYSKWPTCAGQLTAAR